MEAYLKNLDAETISELRRLLQETHDVLDNFNADANNVQPGSGCIFCHSIGYDANGLLHTDDCILIRIRKELT